MNQPKRYLPSWLLISLCMLGGLSSCAELPSKEPSAIAISSASRAPVVPIKIPINLRYAPTSGRASMSTRATENRSSLAQKFEGEMKVRNTGKDLEHTFIADTLYENGKKYSPTSPILYVKIITDDRGTIKDYEISSPALRAANAYEEEAQIIKSAEASASNMSVTKFTQEPITSGDTIFSLPFSKLPDTKNLTDIPVIADGYVFLDGRQTVKASLRSDQKFTSSGGQYSLSASGEVYIDIQTGQRVLAVISFSISSYDNAATLLESSMEWEFSPH